MFIMTKFAIIFTIITILSLLCIWMSPDKKYSGKLYQKILIIGFKIGFSGLALSALISMWIHQIA